MTEFRIIILIMLLAIVCVCGLTYLNGKANEYYRINQPHSCSNCLENIYNITTLPNNSMILFKLNSSYSKCLLWCGDIVS